MRARTRLSARSSIPGSRTRKPSRTTRRLPAGSLRKPRKESQTAATSAAVASRSAQPGSVESEVTRQAL